MSIRVSSVACLHLLVGLLVGCGAGNGDKGGGGAPTTLFTDDFSGSLAAKWIDVSYPGSTATSGDADTLGSPPHGNPSPGIWFQGVVLGASAGGGGAIRTSATFPSASVTFAADARYDSGVQTFAGNYLIFGVYDLNTNALRAAALVLPTTVVYLLYQGTTARQVTQPAPGGNAFHRFALTIDAGGNAAWYRDGALQQSVAGFPTVTLYVRVSGPGATDTIPGVGHADNVLVTTP